MQQSTDLLVAFLYLTSRFVSSLECVQESACSCRMSDGSGTVDISNMGNSDGTPLINNAFAPDNYAYSFNPCYPFSVGTCTNCAACQYDATNVVYYNIGDSSKVTFSFDSGNVVATYVSDDGARSSIGTFVCDQNVDSATYTVDGEVTTAVYSFTITSKYACANGTVPTSSPMTTKTSPSTPRKRECFKIDQCRCEFDDGSGMLDLSRVGRNDGIPLIESEYRNDADTFTYSFNPCYPFSEGTCENAAGCQHDMGNTSLYYNIGDAKRIKFTTENDTVIGTYTSLDGTRKSVVKYVCNPNMPVTAHTVDGEIEDSTYGFTIIGKDLCPRTSAVTSPLTTFSRRTSTASDSKSHDVDRKGDTEYPVHIVVIACAIAGSVILLAGIAGVWHFRKYQRTSNQDGRRFVRFGKS